MLPSSTSFDDDTVVPAACFRCHNPQPECHCGSCSICHATFTIFGESVSVISNRRFCSICQKAVCDAHLAVDRPRWLPNEPTGARLCHRCSPLRALQFVLVDSESLESERTRTQADTTDDGCIWWSKQPRLGLLTLLDAMPPQRRCMDVVNCGQLTGQLTCASCGLPTVPAAPFLEKQTSTEPRGSGDESHELERLLRAEAAASSAIEKRFSDPAKLLELQDQIFANCVPPNLSYADIKAKMMMHQGNRHGHGHGANFTTDSAASSSAPPSAAAAAPPPTEEEKKALYIDMVLCCIASSVSYTYAAGTVCLELELLATAGMLPAAKLLRPLERHASFSLYEAPGRRLVLAIPGTHSVSTVMTDLKADRDVVKETTFLNNGFSAARGSAAAADDDDDDDGGGGGGRGNASAASEAMVKNHGGQVVLYSYRVHSGFLKASQALEHRLPTSMVKRWLTSAPSTLADPASSSSSSRKNKPNKRLLVTGHSLGAACAVLTTLRLIRQDPDFFLADDETIRCHTQGYPLVGNTALTIRMQAFAHKFVHIINENDLVPRLLVMRNKPNELLTSAKSSLESAKKTAAKTVAAGIDYVQSTPLFKKVSGFFTSSKSDASPATSSLAAAATTTTVVAVNSPATNSVVKEHKNSSLQSSVNEQVVTAISCGIASGNRSPPLSAVPSPSVNNITVSSGSGSCIVDAELKRAALLSMGGGGGGGMQALDLDAAQDSHEIDVSEDPAACTTSSGGTVSFSSPSTTAPATSSFKATTTSLPPPPSPKKIVSTPFDCSGAFVFLNPAPSVVNFIATRRHDLPTEYSAGCTSAIRVKTILVTAPSEAFGALREAGGAATLGKAVADHALDRYLRNVCLLGFKK